MEWRGGEPPRHYHYLFYLSEAWACKVDTIIGAITAHDITGTLAGGGGTTINHLGDVVKLTWRDITFIIIII